MIAHLVAFSLAALLLTITPGLDTALVVRTAISEGSRRALLAGLGIASGCLAWGLLVAGGLAVLLGASVIAYDVLRWIGAAYLLYIGVGLIRSPRRDFPIGNADAPSSAGGGWFARGFLSNILNPKIGVFYVSFLPQFIPAGTNVAVMATVLAGIHAMLGIAWFSLLIGATLPLSGLLRRPAVVAWLDRVTGGMFVAFGAALALVRT